MSTPTLSFLGKTYRLASFNKANNCPMWEFVPEGEILKTWTSLLTLVNRTDAVTPADMQALTKGILAYYKTAGSEILLASTVQGDDGKSFNYIVAVFEEVENKRFEVDFVKIAMGEHNAFSLIYGVRISDPVNSAVRTKEFLDEQSSDIGHALGALALPPFATLPKKEFSPFQL